MWDNLRDCRMQLDNTIVRNGSSPVMVDMVDDDNGVMVARCRTLATGRELRIPVADLNLKPVKLGYFNHRGRATYTYRIAKRRWKCGLDSGNLMGSSSQDPDGHRLDPMQYARAVSACIRNAYLAFSEALDRVRVEGGEIAFSRTLAVKKRITGTGLYYKAERIGKILEDNSAELEPKFTYLKQIVEKHTNAN